MIWNLFIDDERFPRDVYWAEERVARKYLLGEWFIARNWAQAADYIGNYGFPNFISFDHDLGKNEKTGYDIVKLLIEDIMDGYYEMPDDFDFYVHSQNPVGKANIESYLKNYLAQKT